MPIRFARRIFSQTARVMFAAILALGVMPAARAQEPQAPQVSPLDALAAKVSASIAMEHDLKNEQAKKKILVVNFSEKARKPSELGGKFADEFASSLRKQAPDFVVIDRDDYLHAAAQDKVPADIVPDEGVSKCYGLQLGANYNAVGILEYAADVIIVRMSVMRNEDQEKIFDGSVSLQYTPEIQVLLATPATAPEVSPPSAFDKNNSANHDRPASNGDLAEAPMAGKKGYTTPSCLYCPRADYSDAAVKAKLKGVVLLNVRIGPSGSTEGVSLVHGLPCELSRMATDAVAGWTFKPANGPDGNPAAVTVPVEVQFNLY
jgi:TonB family protein